MPEDAPLALMPWKRSPSQHADAGCQALARGGDRWHFLLSVWAWAPLLGGVPWVVGGVLTWFTGRGRNLGEVSC